MSTETVSSEFDIFAYMPIESSVLEKTEVTYKPISSVDQSDLEFLLPGDNDTYIDRNIKIYIRGKLTKADATVLDGTNFTTVTNNFLHSLFGQCNFDLSGVSITPATDLYISRSFLETILTYCSDAAASHLTNDFWYLENGNLLPCDPTAADAKNKVFIVR